MSGLYFYEPQKKEYIFVVKVYQKGNADDSYDQFTLFPSSPL